MERLRDILFTPWGLIKLVTIVVILGTIWDVARLALIGIRAGIQAGLSDLQVTDQAKSDIIKKVRNQRTPFLDIWFWILEKVRKGVKPKN